MAPHETSDQDIQWTRIVELELVPHPDQPRPEITEMDYGMQGGVLRMNLRAATAGYILRKWSVDCSPDHSLRGHEYRLWLKDHLAIYGVRNAVLAPGYRSLINNGSKPSRTEGMSMLAKLERLIGEIGDLNSKLILLVGPSRSGKTQLLRQLGVKLNIEPLNVGRWSWGAVWLPRRTTSAASRQANCCGDRGQGTN